MAASEPVRPEAGGTETGQSPTLRQGGAIEKLIEFSAHNKFLVLTFVVVGVVGSVWAPHPPPARGGGRTENLTGSPPHNNSLARPLVVGAMRGPFGPLTPTPTKVRT